MTISIKTINQNKPSTATAWHQGEDIVLSAGGQVTLIPLAEAQRLADYIKPTQEVQA